MKKCTKCFKEKSVDEFYKQTKHKDGLQYECKDCHRKGMDDWRGLNKDKISGYAKKYNRNNPHKCRAKEAVKRAIKSGKLVRGPCIVCGDSNSQGHHESYLKEDRLKIVLLCQIHHKQRHMKLA